MLFVALLHTVYMSVNSKNWQFHCQTLGHSELWVVFSSVSSTIGKQIADVLFSFSGTCGSVCQFIWKSHFVWFLFQVTVLKCQWHAAMTVTHSRWGLATCLNICTRAFQLLVINWLLDLLPQAECSRIKMNSSFIMDLESWEPLQDTLPLSTVRFYCRASQPT